MKKRLRYLIPILVVILVIGLVASVIVGYFNFITRKMESDSKQHLGEIYEQVDHSFLSFIEKNWGLLNSCNDYFELAVRDESTKGGAETAIQTFIYTKKNYWNFSDFFFLNKDREFITLDGDRGKLALGQVWDEAIEKKEPIMAGEELDGQNITVFAVSSNHESYRGFEYDAIAISYTNTDIALALNANAFHGDAKCFIVNQSGEVLLTTWEGGGVFKNYFTYLSRALISAGVGEEEQKEIVERIRSDFEQMLKNSDKADLDERGYLQTPLEVEGKIHCIVYLPVGYRDYFLMSVVPQETVSTGFLSAQRATLRVMLIIFGLVGMVVIALLISRIISQSRKNKTELSYRERMFDVLSNSVDDIFIMLDPETQRVDYLSPNVERLLGIQNESVKKDIRTMARCAVDYNIVVPKGDLDDIPMNGNKSWECEYMHQATGERRWYRVMIYHMNINNVKKYIVVMSDRTHEQQMNQKLQEALDAAKSANEAKSNFLSNMSHDIRTPMNAIVGFSVLLERNVNDPEKVSEYTHKIMASSHHLLSLINDVLDMSKIESGKTSLNVGKFSLPDLLEELKIIILPQANAKNQQFTIHTQGTPPEFLMGDKLRLNQILINLLSNAVKYTQTGGTISFTISQVPDAAPQYAKLRFIVKDNGMGMSEDFQKILFSPFSREKNSVVNSIQGTGLGMAITKNLVDLMGGIIQVESAPNRGSTFTVELSFALAETEDDSWYQNRITRILVADDEEDICIGIKDMLYETGIDVRYVTNGAAAVDEALSAHRKGEDFNVILLDWKMPGQDGVETARKIRQKIDKDIPILVLTSYDWTEIEAEAREAGINAFLPKPFFPSTFLATIKPLFSLPDSDQPQEEPQFQNALQGRLFLVAEDNELNAEILTEMLEIDGAHCEIAQNGKIALEMFEKSEPGKYDMILMDVQMPVMNGYEATRAIRASSHRCAKTIPIVAMTANTFAEDVRNAFDAGMDGHLAKPINMDAVRKTVAQLLHTEEEKKNREDPS